MQTVAVSGEGASWLNADVMDVEQWSQCGGVYDIFVVIATKVEVNLEAHGRS
jgi:hypothetical protein